MVHSRAPAVFLGGGALLLLCPGLSWALPLAITIVDGSVTLSPNQTDYETGYVEVTGMAGIRVRVSTDNAAGLILYVRCDDVSPAIPLNDLLVKSATAGTLIASYTAITGADQALWSTGGTVTNQNIDTDVRIQNLWNLSDAAGGGTTAYTNTLTYTVVDQ
jgi:hypothetical protein